MKKSLPIAVAVLSAATTAAAPATALAKTKYTGATSTFKYGTVDVTITVAKKKMTVISVEYGSKNNARSAQLDAAALPTLWKEALKSQTWNVHTVSGASFTSTAFRKSLHSAMSHADLLKK